MYAKCIFINTIVSGLVLSIFLPIVIIILLAIEVGACLKELPAYLPVNGGSTSKGCDVVYLVPEERSILSRSN
ncbi:hypothetical protein JYT87_03980 [Nitrospira defluvii]|nr:hypothetical protein [Nitrospira defluvii]